MLQLKKDPWVLLSFTILAIGLGVLCKYGAITWPQMLAGLGVLLTPSILGRAAKDDDDKTDDDKKDPPAGGSVPMVITPIMVFALVCALALSSSGCTPAMRKAVVYLLADTAKCIFGHPDLPDDQVAKLCGVEAAQHDAMRELLAQSRMVTAKAAADAAARAGAARCVAAGP